MLEIVNTYLSQGLKYNLFRIPILGFLGAIIFLNFLVGIFELILSLVGYVKMFIGWIKKPKIEAEGTNMD